MGNNNLHLSLCIPTNGMVEWIIPVINSIYYQNIDDNLFEVVVTDNGTGEELHEKIKEIMTMHNNLIYKKTNSLLFQNQIDCFKLANGNLVKFVNHRFTLLNGTLEKLINISKNHNQDKPIIYFLNKNIKKVCTNKLLNFDEFIFNLSYYSSWSGGISYWKCDFDRIFNKSEYDKYFPHLDILFSFKDNRKYEINNEILFESLPHDVLKKGKYDLFDAFLVDFMDNIYSLYKNSFISKNTYKKVKCDNLFFCISLHFEYVVRKQKCSYILRNFWKSFIKYYNPYDFALGYLIVIIKILISSMKKILNLII